MGIQSSSNYASSQNLDAHVEGALMILEHEAGLSKETMATLRQAVESGMSRRRNAAAREQEIANAGAMFGMLATTRALGTDKLEMINAFRQVSTPQAVQMNGLPSQFAIAAAAQSAPAALPQTSLGMGTGTLVQVPGYDNLYPYVPQHRNVKPAGSKRQQLTVEEAAEIYLLRPRRGEVRSGCTVHCRMLAPRYGVTPKTIRDVWSGRTWAEATRHLWTEEEKAQRERNKGVKDEKQSDSEGDADDDYAGNGEEQMKRRPSKENSDDALGKDFKRVKSEDGAGQTAHADTRH